jgi:cytidylate kinase
MPVITVSRMFGSGGSEVAERVAAALGYALLDNAFVERVASESGVPPAEIEAREERLPSLAERLADVLTFGSPEVVTTVTSASLPITEERLLEVTRHVIDQAVAQGPVVLVGRGAQQYLAARDDALHVFCCAPRDALIARIMDREHVSRERAARLVDETNRHREQYVRRLWHRDWQAASNYHLCVNTGWLGIDGSVAMVTAAARARLGSTSST